MPRRAQIIIEISDEGNIQVALQGQITAAEAVFAVEHLKQAIFQELKIQKIPALRGMPPFIPKEVA